jgi:hypothetical protein
LAKELGRAKQTGLETDLRVSRARLVRALQAAHGPLVSSELVRPWLAEINGAMDTEKDLRAKLTNRLNKLCSAVVQNPSQAVRDRLKARIKALHDAHTTSLRVSEILELAAACETVPQRKHVLGLRVAGEGAARTVCAAQRRALPEALRRIPGLWLDATGDERHYRALLGGEADLTVRRIEAKPVNYRLTQVVDLPFAKSRIIPTGKSKAGKKWRTDSHVDRLIRFVLYMSCLHRGRSGGAKDVLVIAPKKVRAVIEDLLPDNVAVLNFGKLRGIDKYRDVPCLIVVGREMPAMAQLELMTEALHWDNRNVTEVTHVAEGEWPRAPVVLNRAGDRAVEIKGERHPDPNVAALQYEISGAEVEQALGRARLVDRTATKPCDVYLFGQTPTRTPAHRIINWVDADRDLAEIMAAAGVFFARGDTIAQAFPGLMPDAEARRKEAAAHAWQRGQLQANGSLAPYRISSLYGDKEPFLGNCPPTPAFRHGEFRLAGEGDQRAASRQPVLIDTARHGDPAAAIAALLRIHPERVQWLGWREREARSPDAAPAARSAKRGPVPSANPTAAALKKRAQRAKARSAKQAPTT